MKPSDDFGKRIANDERSLNYLKKWPKEASDIKPEWRSIPVSGGFIASGCMDDHEEVMGCWAFYAKAIVH